MKKITVLLMALLVVMLVACNNASPLTEEKDVASLMFSEEEVVKSLSSGITATAAKDLYWFYTAVKTSDGPQTGITTASGTDMNKHVITDAKPVCAGSPETVSGGKGLTGYVVSPFSVGKWTFRLYGYTSNNRAENTLVYTYSSSAVDTTGQAATVGVGSVGTVQVPVVAVSTEGSGTLKIGEITAAEGPTTPSFYYKLDDATSWTALAGSVIANAGVSMSSGNHDVLIGAFYTAPGDLSTAKTDFTGKIRVTIYNSFTTTVSGSIDDLTGGVQFSDPATPSLQLYNVIYDKNGATDGSVPVDDKVYKKGDSATVLGNTGSSALSKNGYTFAGWTTEKNATSGTVYGTASGQTKTITIGEASITLYAKWTYTITYNGNDNTGGTVPNQQTAVAGNSVTLAAKPDGLVRDNYTFSGWNTANDGSGLDYAAGSAVSGGIPGGNTTLYAKWTYTIKYEGNGNTGGAVPAVQTAIAGQDVMLATNSGSLAKANNVLIGWNTSNNGTGTDYHASGCTVKDGLTPDINSNVTLYARWELAVGGRIFYIAEKTDYGASWTEGTDSFATYNFYDEDGNGLSTQTVAGLADAYYYKITNGTSTKDKFYVYDNGTRSGTTCDATGGLACLAWGNNGTSISDTDGVAPRGTKGFGQGKVNTKACLDKEKESSLTWGAGSIFGYVKACRTYNTIGLGGCVDWYIGSDAELEKLRLSGLTVGWNSTNPTKSWFDSHPIWSSGEHNAYFGCIWSQGSTRWTDSQKYLSYYGGAMRSF